MEKELIPLTMDLGGGKNPRGLICAANEDRFTASHFSEPLTAFAVGMPDSEGLQTLLDTLFPPVQVGRRFEYKKDSSSEFLLSETDDIRAIGQAAFKKDTYEGESVNAKTHNKGLLVTLDRDEMVDGDEERTVRRLTGRLIRNDIRRGITALIAAATNTAKTWGSSADPDGDVLADLNTAGDAAGIDPNLVAYGQTAWILRATAFRAQNVAGAYASAQMTPEQVANLLGIDKVVISKERYRTGKGKTLAKLLANYVFMYYANQNADREDPSNAKRFVTPTESGKFRVYREERAKTIDISVEHYSLIAIPNTTGIRMFTVS